MDELTVNITQNSATSFRKGISQPKSNYETNPPIQLNDDCHQDAQNCQYLQFFNSKEKKLYTKFQDGFKANFFCRCSPQQCPHNYLFLTGTYNTTQTNHYAFTRNYNTSDPCWDIHPFWMKDWAQKQDPQAEPMKILLPPVQEDATQFSTIKKHFAQFVKDVNRVFKPSNWKWVVVFELQKNTGNWHWHLFSTPFIPYSHKCSDQGSCWDCRTYVNKLWTYGRVQSLPLTKQSARNYLAKYITKSFHLRTIYENHGFKEKDRIYHFFQNLYQYEQREVLKVGKLDATTGQKLNNNQHICRSFNYSTNQTTYFYRTNRKLIGKRTHPKIEKKSIRYGSRFSNPLPLTKLAYKHPQKEEFLFHKPSQVYTQDFRQFLFTTLLLYCQTAKASHIPLERKHIPKEGGECSNSIDQHFETKLIFHFTFASKNIPKVREFLAKLDTYAHDYGFDTDQDFFDPRFTDPIASRNAYLNNWQMDCLDYFNSKQPISKQPLFIREGRTAM